MTEKASMRAVVFNGTRDVRLVEKPVPKLELERDALVRMELTSICGTDLHPYRGEKPGLDVGTTMAHEVVGTIVELGPAVKSLKVGQRVVSAFTTCCGACWFCSHKLTCRCEHELGARCYGWVSGGTGLEGVQAEFVRVPLADTTLLPVPEGVPPELALLCADVLPTGWFCAERGGITELLREQGSATAAVIGCGPVGLAAVAAARSLGASKVFAVDSNTERLKIAESLGAVPVRAGEDAAAQLRAETGGRGVDCALEAVGAPAALRCAFDAIRMGGVISSVGMHHTDQFAFSPTEGYNRNVTYRNGRCPARVYMGELLDRLASGDEALTATRTLITHRVPLADEAAVVEVYRQFDQGKQLKVLVHA